MANRTRQRAERRWRKPMRLPGHDYRLPGAYHVTIVTWQRQCLFGEIVAGQMTLNDLGRIAQEEWWRTPGLRPGVRIDATIVMPNHIHSIIWLDARPELWSADQLMRRERTAAGPAAQSLGALIAQTKAAIGRRINVARDSSGSRVWQPGYHDRIIRTVDELHAVRAYILANPAHWADDEEWPSDMAAAGETAKG